MRGGERGLSTHAPKDSGKTNLSLAIGHWSLVIGYCSFAIRLPAPRYPLPAFSYSHTLRCALYLSAGPVSPAEPPVPVFPTPFGFPPDELIGPEQCEDLGVGGVQSELNIVCGIDVFHKKVTQGGGDAAELQRLACPCAQILNARIAAVIRLIDVQITRTAHGGCETLNRQRRLDVDFICHIDFG